MIEVEERDFQLRAVRRAARLPGRPIFVSPTGSGKTIMQVLVAKKALDSGRESAIYTPRQEIFRQTEQWANSILGPENVGILRAGEPWNSHKPVHIVSWPTVVRRMARSIHSIPKVDFVQVDEAHLSVSPKMLELLEYHAEQDAQIIGWTATPARPTGTGLGVFWDQIVPVTTVEKLLADGFLNPNEYWGGKYADVTGLAIKQGDYDNAGLSARSMPLIGDVIENWLKLAKDRHTIVFAVDISHAEALADRFMQSGVSAVALHNKTTPARRIEIVDKFKAGVIQVLVNVTVASYGFDAPSVDCIVLARRTRSIVLHLQMLGRGMRPGPGKRPTMVLDHANNVRTLGKAEDLYRWQLEKGKKACSNVTKEVSEREHIQDHTCDCGYMFSGRRDCPSCGLEIPLAKRDVETTDDELVRLSQERNQPVGEGFPNKEMFFRMLMKICADKRYSMGWAKHAYKKKVGDWPPRAWENLGSLPASQQVRNYITKQGQNYARRRSYGRAKAAR